MLILGYFAAVFIGMIIGMMGAGGSILTVPVLVFLFGVDPLLATSYSLFIVGLTSLVGVVPYFRNQLVDFRMGAILGVPAFLTVYLTRAFLQPAIPDILWTNQELIIDKGDGTLFLLCVLMIISAVRMIKNSRNHTPGLDQISSDHLGEKKYLQIALWGAVIGVLSGLVGVGGGFLMIPALTIFANMPMKKAVGTSLAVIACSSLIGFSSKIDPVQTDWKFMIVITCIALVGMIIGFFFAKKIEGNQLMKSFAIFMLAVVGWIVIEMFIF